MIEALFTFLTGAFVFGTFTFWVFILVMALVIAAEVHWDKGTGATVTLIATVLVVNFFSGVPILKYVFSNFGWFLLGAVLYIAIGGAVSLGKLALVVRGIDQRYARARIEFLRTKELGDGTDLKTAELQLKQEWTEYLERHAQFVDLDRVTGRATFDRVKRRATLIMWVGHWPFTALGTLLNDPVRQMVTFTVETLDGAYARIINASLGHTQGEVTTSKEARTLEPAPDRGRGQQDRF